MLWMAFFDINNLFTMNKMRTTEKELEQQRDYYKQNIEKIQEDIKLLRTNDKHLEKFARENYLMHKEYEDVYIIVKEKNKQE